MNPKARIKGEGRPHPHASWSYACFVPVGTNASRRWISDFEVLRCLHAIGRLVHLTMKWVGFSLRPFGPFPRSVEQANDADVQLHVLQHLPLARASRTEVVSSARSAQIYETRPASDYGFRWLPSFFLADADSDDDGPELKQKRVRRKKDAQETQHGKLCSVTEQGGLQIL